MSPCSTLLALWVAALPAASNLPEARILLDGLEARQRQFEEALNDYTFDQELSYEQLDKRGAVTSRRTRQYEVFFVNRKRVRRLVAEDGKTLAPERQAKVDADLRRYVDEVKKGKARPPRHDDVSLSDLLARYDFRSVARETIEGRPAILMEFAALPGKRDLKNDGILRRLAGRVWVDEAERVVVRVVIHSVGTLKVALGLGASIGAAEVQAEFVKVDEGVWLPRRTQSLVQGRILLLKGIHERTTGTFSRYRRFSVESHETPTLPRP